MGESDLEDFLILRELDEPITRDDLEAVDERSTACRRELDDEGMNVRAVESEVLTDEDGNVTGTHCHYKAESEAAVREHANRAGLPVSRIDRPGRPIGGDFE
ncbi:DUF4242 domain-containing protein [Natronorubrum sp. JWXQ-INN-674]|uniref:DUF4242 domain-containing protein n=1 Tax=Natronorubrum halalkaliphilum TaxID=2691917 RepID=A0A6B0VNT6_9EURY|nr:DUF4242 domain-containing protein [Natronorubrum halalkaliphilum]MXV62797.1 DUF4242 domain-containing protein [Natronorubrum halalkaliphilum]